MRPWLSPLLILLGFLSGCTTDEPSPAPPSPTDLPATITDDVGRRIERPSSPRRIVTLAPELAELVFAFGGGDRVAAVSEFTNTPDAAARLPKVGLVVQPSVEAVMSHSPDLVLASGHGNPRAAVERMESLGLTVYVYWPQRVEEMGPAIERLGEVCGCSREARDLARRVREEFEALRDPTPRADRPSAILLFNHDPLVAAGPSTLGARLLEWVGGANLLSEADSPNLYPLVSMEMLLMRQPEIILLANQAEGEPAMPAYWARFPLNAARSEGVFRLDPDLISRAGPRLVLAAKVMRQAVLRAREKRAGSAAPAEP